MSVDLALIEGKIFTMNPLKPCVEAVAVKSGKILKVGKNSEIRKMIDKNTRVIRLDKKTVLPGFIDTHIHVADFSRLLLWLDLSDLSSIKEMQILLKERLSKVALGKWIVGRGWNEKHFEEKRLPDRFDLDTVAPDNPVILYYNCGPVCVVNKKALELAEITKTSTAPEGGVIDKDPNTGELTGILRGTATDLVWSKIPEPSNQELAEAATLAFNRIAAAGITSIHWLATSQVDLSILQNLIMNRQLQVRVYMIIPVDLMAKFRSVEFLRVDQVRAGGIEVLADGFLSSDTAALFEPYVSNNLLKGKLLYSPQEMKGLAEKIVCAGLQLVIHAMGDKAIDAALTTIETCKGDGRHRLDQAALFTKDLVQRAKRQNVVVSVQPLVGESEFTVYSAIEHLGGERARDLYPLKTLFQNGICVCGGSDCPMEALNPLLAIQSVVRRQFFPEEQLTVDEALQMYTINSAYASSDEKIKGSIEEGKLADFIVLSRDPHQVAPNEIKNITVELTIVGGRIVYP